MRLWSPTPYPGDFAFRGCGDERAFGGAQAAWRQDGAEKPGGQRPIRAFIQPVPTREEVIPGEKTAIGWVDHCLWSYTGMEEVQPGDILVWLKTPYRVRTSRAYYVGGKLHPWWASLEEAREAAE